MNLGASVLGSTGARGKRAAGENLGDQTAMGTAASTGGGGGGGTLGLTIVGSAGGCLSRTAAFVCAGRNTGCTGAGDKRTPNRISKSSTDSCKETEQMKKREKHIVRIRTFFFSF